MVSRIRNERLCASPGWILSRARDVHEGFDYMAKIFRAMHILLGAFNMLLLFAFRFCYAGSRAAFCIRRIQTFDVRMNGYFRATLLLCGLTFMRITFIEVRSTSAWCLRAVESSSE